MADNKRVFGQHNADSGEMEWFFIAREGLQGPFATEELASTELGRYIEYCMFDAKRIFAERNESNGEMEWFFVARGSIEGPYQSETLAQNALEAYISARRAERKNPGVTSGLAKTPG